MKFAHLTSDYPWSCLENLVENTIPNVDALEERVLHVADFKTPDLLTWQGGMGNWNPVIRN